MGCALHGACLRSLKGTTDPVRSVGFGERAASFQGSAAGREAARKTWQPLRGPPCACCFRQERFHGRGGARRVFIPTRRCLLALLFSLRQGAANQLSSLPPASAVHQREGGDSSSRLGIPSCEAGGGGALPFPTSPPPFLQLEHFLSRCEAHQGSPPPHSQYLLKDDQCGL